MNLKNNWWVFQSALSDKFCQDVVKLGNSLKQEKGLVGGKNLARGEKNYKIRNSDLCWFNDLWVSRIIQNYIQIANKQANWNFDWDYCEDFQFTKYKKNQHYDWHCDSTLEVYMDQPNINYNGKTRKLSVIVSLSDPEDFKGGKLEFQFRQGSKNFTKKFVCKEILPKGSILVFPSFIYHRVTPVTKGTRYSLVNWVLGAPFK
jgi:PKHD-type hydroxylase|tara:strand:+ start:1413 stop:2021 length:609 start_codon:yes stop_codon:yes gene_type:complete